MEETEDKLRRIIRDKLLCPIVSSAITTLTACLISLLFIYPFFASQKIKETEAVDLITKKVDEKVLPCGKDFWMTWIVIDPNERTYRFQNIKGLNADETEIISPKDLKLNPFYAGTHKIDRATFNFLDGFKTGAAGFYSDLSYFNDKEGAKQIINATNKTVYQIGISVTKNIFNNMVYVFIASSTKEELGVCNSDKIVRDLEDLSIYAKGLL